MTHEEAAKMKKGDVVITPHSRPPYTPLKLTDVRPSGVTGTRYSFRIAQLSREHFWLDPAHFERPPRGAAWNGKAWMIAIPDPANPRQLKATDKPAKLPEFAKPFAEDEPAGV